MHNRPFQGVFRGGTETFLGPINGHERSEGPFWAQKSRDSPPKNPEKWPIMHVLPAKKNNHQHFQKKSSVLVFLCTDYYILIIIN